MARRKTLPESVRAKLDLAERLGMLRAELFGERGGPEMARRLNIPVRTWYNYEGGVTVPAEVMLKIIELTSVEPIWLLHGNGPKFRVNRGERPDGGGKPSKTVGALLRTALLMLETDDPVRVKTEHIGFGPGTFDHSSPAADFSAFMNGGSPRPASAAERDAPAVAEEPARTIPSMRDWSDAQRDGRCLLISGDSMSPIIADGASVAYSDREEAAALLDGKLVVFWAEARPIVRWFQDCGRYALLRAQNPETSPPQMLVELDGGPETPRFRRVLWINTPH